MDCAHALWVVHSIKRLISLILVKWFYLIVLFILCIGCLTKIVNRLVVCMDTVAALPHAHIDSLHTHMFTGGRHGVLWCICLQVAGMVYSGAYVYRWQAWCATS